MDTSKTVTFNDVERKIVRNYILSHAWPSRAREDIAKTFDNTTEFEITEVRDRDKYVDGIAISNGHMTNSYFSLEEIRKYLIDNGIVNGKEVIIA